MNPDDENEELQLFRQKWKEELRKDLSDGFKTNCPSDEGNQRGWQTDRKRNVPGVFHCFGEEMRQSGDEMDPVDCLKSRDKSLQMPEGKSVGPFAKENNGIVLLNLPEPITRNANNNTSDCKIQQSIAICAVRSKKSLLEQLIDDINEITSIPFFDLSLPKEVGIQIFNHLRVKDLCACAQVSKSWKILSEDELIWYRIGCKLGYIQERDSAAIDRANWKAFVRERVLEERELRRNWKERMCRLSSMEFERGGSLCAVSVHGDLVCSGYSSGAVVIWKGSVDGVSSYRELDTTDDTQRQKPQVASTAIHNALCAAGFDNGDVYVWHTSLGSSPLCHCRCEGSVKSVSLATSGPPTFAAMSDHDLQVQLSDSNGQWTCLESRNFEDKTGQAMFIPSSSTGSSSEHVAIATQDTLSVMAPGKGFLSTLDHVIGGKLSCMDCTADRLAVGVGSYGYGTLGNKVRLYCLETTKMISILGPHHREITCLDVVSCPPHRLVTGSYDCRVRVFDLRTEKIALSFHLGHKRAVTAVQMDDWKVVSGAEEGTLLVWDQRMTSALWMTHARHPVRLCKLQGSRMITANIPADKSPRENLWYADDLILHRRHRGVIRMFDFSVNNETEGIPDICSSNYDDTSGYNYNIKLSVPYDSIEL